MTPRKQFNTLSDIIPDIVRKYRTLRPTEIAEKILSDYNTETTPQSVTMFFKRHPDIEATLQKELVSEGKAEIECSEALYQNEAFKELPSVKKWITEMTGRISPKMIDNHICSLRFVCMGAYVVEGIKPDGSTSRTKQTIEGWAFKHPDRLTLQHAKEYLAELHKVGKGTHHFRIALRSFFLSRDSITVKATDISGDKGKLGKWGRVVVAKETLYQIINYIKERNFEYGVANHFSYKTATRIQATLEETRKSNMHFEGGVHTITIVDKGLHRKGRQTWEKIIPENLYAELFQLFQTNGDYAFKNVDPDQLREMNKEAYRIFLKDDPNALDLALNEPFHFWRHMFAQHMLRALKWNYDLVAELGGWSDTKTLKACYGSPPMNVLREAGLQTIPTI